MDSVLWIVAVRDIWLQAKMLDLTLVIVSGSTLITAIQLNVEEMTKLLQDAVDQVRLLGAQTILLMESYVASWLF